MESIGQKLKTAREEKGYSTDQVARDTNIARRFIVAMEEEDFSVFPGDTYLLGFLRNYADYLGLDTERIVNLYHNMKIQEQPVPMEELIKPKKKMPGIGLVLAIVALVAVLAGGGFGLYILFSGDSAPEQELTAEESRQAAEEDQDQEDVYQLVEEIVTRRFPAGQRVLVHLSEENIPLTIDSVGEKVLINSPAGESAVALGESVNIDLSLDGQDDILVEVQDIDPEGETAVIRFDRGLGRPEQPAAFAEGADQIQQASTSMGSTTVAARRQREQVILTAPSPEPFRFDAVLRGYSLIRYLKDGAVREQRYFDKGETFRLNVDREMMLWVSNAGSVSAKIGGEDIDLGGPGEVAVKLIRWQEAEDASEYQLTLFPVY